MLLLVSGCVGGAVSVVTTCPSSSNVFCTSVGGASFGTSSTGSSPFSGTGRDRDSGHEEKLVLSNAIVCVCVCLCVCVCVLSKK